MSFSALHTSSGGIQVTIEAIADWVGKHLPVVILQAYPGGAAVIHAPQDLEALSTGAYAQALGWVKTGREDRLGPAARAGLILCTADSAALIGGRLQAHLLITPEPRRDFALLVAAFFAPPRPVCIEPTAVIDPSAEIGAGVYVGHYVVIEAGAIVGADSVIYHHTVIGRGVRIGARVSIGAHCTIGLPGFGYERNAEGHWQAIPHTGTVEIGDDCSIHSNTCIDRAVMGATRIGAHTKIDNLVHVAHGVQVGPDVALIANSMIAGSVTIGAGSWIAPSVSVINGVAVGRDVSTGLGAVIVKPVADGQLVVGAPAEPMADYRRWLAVRKQLLSSPPADGSASSSGPAADKV